MEILILIYVVGFFVSLTIFNMFHCFSGSGVVKFIMALIFPVGLIAALFE